MINVLELIDGGFIGGGQTHILSLVNCLDKDKFRPVIAASEIGEFGNRADGYGFAFEAIELPKIFRSKHLKKLDEIIRRNSIDIIHSHGGVAGMYARFYKKNFSNVKVIHTIHGIHYVNSPGALRKFFSLAVEQYLVPFANKYICVSESDFEKAEAIKIINPVKTSVIKNGISLRKFQRKEKPQKLMSQFGIKNDDLIIGNVSRFDFQKNQRFLLKNMNHIFEKFPQAKLILAGSGKFFDECKNAAMNSPYSDRIFFAGEVSSPEDYYSLFDIFVFPTLWEGFSISLIEAMASSDCILASGIPANCELIDDNVNGYLFNPEDKDDFLHKLEKLIVNKELRKEFSEKAFEKSKKFSEEMMTTGIQNEYLKLSD